MVGSWRLLPWQIERQLWLLHSAVTGSKLNVVWANQWQQKLPVRHHLCTCCPPKVPSGYLVESEFWVQGRQHVKWWALGRGAVEDRSSLWLSLILVVARWALMFLVILLCPVLILFLSEVQEVTDHLPKYQESMLLWPGSKGSWQSIWVRRAECGMSLEQPRGEVC